MRRTLRRLALWAFHVGFGRPVLRWVAGARYRRRNLVPDEPCVVVSNHNSHLDAALLMGLFPLRRLPHVHPVAAADYFGQTWLKRTMALLFMNAITIERKPPKGQDPMAPIAEHLRAGESLILFPEGSRGEAGVIARFRPGIGRLAQLAPGTPIVPVFLSGPERIWARGTLLPVPQAIDVLVGKPRTFDPELDARDIAAQLQRDVVALAPPAPPPPAPQREPARGVAVCGGDPELRHRVVRAICERLGREGKTLALTEPTLEADADGVREINAPLPAFRGGRWLRPLAARFRNGPRFIETIERAQLDEAAHRAAGTDFVVTDGSALVDAVARVAAEAGDDGPDDAALHRLTRYLRGEVKVPLRRTWGALREMPGVWLVNQLDLARPPVPEVLVYLAGTGDASLHASYRRVGEVVRRRRKVAWLEFDAATVGSEGVAPVVDAVAGELLRPAPAADADPAAADGT